MDNPRSSRLFTLMQNAKVIGLLESGDKLRTNCDEFTIDKPGALTWVYRYLIRETRFDNFKHVSETAKEIQNIMQDSSDETLNQTLNDHINMMLRGIGNLKNTYTTDPRAIAKLCTIEVMLKSATGMHRTQRLALEPE